MDNQKTILEQRKSNIQAKLEKALRMEAHHEFEMRDYNSQAGRYQKQLEEVEKELAKINK